ncbi:MAG: HAD-IIA family hydrolase [Anaerolineae bacterium]|nr:HAD-IIA family hydrolase [Anaerolineae bacterium]
MSIQLDTVRAVVLDMDGVLWRGGEPLPGVAEFFVFLTEQGIPFTLATNNSTKTVDAYVERLNNAGVPANPEQIITSAVATADYIAHHYPVDTPVYVIGETGIRRVLAELGYRHDPDNAQVVVVGLDFKVTYDMLKIATLRIRGGADFIGTNGDLTFPMPEGMVPGNGAFLAALQASTDVAPVVIGKPETAMFEVALSRMQTAPEHTLMIGDRLETDILGGQRAGLQTALVLTGITTEEESRTASIQADGVFDDLAALHAAWVSSLKLAV